MTSGYSPTSLESSLSPGEYRTRLAREVLLDLEQRRQGAEQILYKCVRLAQAAKDTAVAEWLSAELGGYPTELSDELASRMLAVGRLVPHRRLGFDAVAMSAFPEQFCEYDRDHIVHRESLQRIEDEILPAHYEGIEKTRQAEVFNRGKLRSVGWASSHDPKQYERVALRTQEELIELLGLTRKVRAELHRYVADLFHRFLFADSTTAVFDRHFWAIERLLRATDPELLDRLPGIGARLAEGDSTAVVQAMSACRRLIGDFADAVRPPSDEPIVDQHGVSHDMKRDKVLNRIQEALRQKCPSDSRVSRLRRTLNDLYERVSAGMKSDISREEAQSLVVMTYVALGESAEILNGE